MSFLQELIAARVDSRESYTSFGRSASSGNTLSVKAGGVPHSVLGRGCLYLATRKL